MDNLPEAMKVLIKNLKEDSAYYYTWQANIAMAFKDEFSRAKMANSEKDSPDRLTDPQHIHDIANKAAKTFLDVLTM